MLNRRRFVGIGIAGLLMLILSATIFAFLMSDSADWRDGLPRPVFDERPELAELYGKAWEIAHTRIDNLPGIPVPRYMDEGHRSDWIWIWDTCFMAHFCKYMPDEFPGIARQPLELRAEGAF